jgi:hypothetical protein
MAAFEIQRLETFGKINLDQNVGIHDTNLDCKVLKCFIKFFPFYMFCDLKNNKSQIYK